jgi:xanthine dehydrogenase accessory factor
MICSGEQTFVLMHLSKRDLDAVTALALATARPGGVLHLGADGLAYDPEGLLDSKRQFVSGAQWSYDEDWGRRDHLHLVGGGHCALALSQLASGLDFQITVYDDRPGLPTFEANTWADQKVLLPDYSTVGEYIAPGAQQFVCVMTFGYVTDDKALRALLGRDYAFLGSLGSRSKIDKLLAAYTDEGWPAEALRRLHAPLGVPIHSQTPAEIAVSIAAQLIRVRNEPARRNL